jgi:DNA end-binding protein Ku
VPRSQIDQRFFDAPYYVTPSEPVGQEAFAVTREAMRGKGMVALGRLVLSKRERVIALEAYDKGLLGTTLRYPYEVRKAEEAVTAPCIWCWTPRPASACDSPWGTRTPLSG